MLSSRRFIGVWLRWRVLAIALSVATLAMTTASAADTVTVRHGGKTIRIQDALDDPKDLWVLPADLTRINGFVLKPEGACLDDICIPIRHDRDSELLVTRAGTQWINLSAFARKINQRFTVDYDKRIWNFGPLPFKTSGAAAAAPKKDTRQ